MKNKILQSAFIGIFFCSSIISQTNWTKHPTPTLPRTATFPDWKGLATADPFVMKDNDTLKMWFSGSGWLTSSDDCPHLRIGYAWSLDGINWNEYENNPVLDRSLNPNDFDYDGIETPTIIKDLNAPANERYKLWYAGRKLNCSNVQDHEIGYAFSPDGLNWTKYSGNPVIVPGDYSHWFNTATYGPSVILDGGIYKMWFTGLDAFANSQTTDGKANIVYATSTDAINWSIYPTPVLEAGTQNNWDLVVCAEPSVIKVGNLYQMFYSALDQWNIETFQVGYAWSSDGINWIKSSQNPVLKIGKSNQWDGFWASHPTVIFDSLENKFKLWYTGRDTTSIVSLTGYYWDIGYAESSLSLGIHDFFDDRVKIYPNPSNGVLNIKIPPELINSQIKIYNNVGQLVKCESHLGKNINEIKIVELENGFYNIELENENIRVTRKLILCK